MYTRLPASGHGEMAHAHFLKPPLRISHLSVVEQARLPRSVHHLGHLRGHLGGAGKRAAATGRGRTRLRGTRGSTLIDNGVVLSLYHFLFRNHAIVWAFRLVESGLNGL